MECADEASRTLASGTSGPSAVSWRCRPLQLSGAGYSVPRPEREFQFFVKAEQRPSCSECEALVRTFMGWAKVGSLYVAIRNDAWFASQFYPAVFRFEPDNATGVRYSLAGNPTPPTVPEYYHSPMAECHLLSG